MISGHLTVYAGLQALSPYEEILEGPTTLYLTLRQMDEIPAAGLG